MTTRTWSIAILTTLAAASPTLGGEIHGVLRVPSHGEPASALQPYPGQANTLPGAKPPIRGAVTDAVIYVDSLPAGEPSASPSGKRVTLAQKNEAFLPRVVAVAAGTTVDFPNLDPIYHNVFSVSPSRRFDLGKYPRGQSRTVQFPRSGVVNVFCDIHADMAAFILVTPTSVWVRPGSDGRFALSDLPAGRYRVRWWHPDLGDGAAEVDVPAEGAVTLDVRW